MEKEIANQVAKKYLRKLCLDYPSVGSLIMGDEWAEGIIERAILEALQQSVHPTGLNAAQKEEVRQMIQSALDTGSA